MQQAALSVTLRAAQHSPRRPTCSVPTKPSRTPLPAPAWPSTTSCVTPVSARASSRRHSLDWSAQPVVVAAGDSAPGVGSSAVRQHHRRGARAIRCSPGWSPCTAQRITPLPSPSRPRVRRRSVVRPRCALRSAPAGHTSRGGIVRSSRRGA